MQQVMPVFHERKIEHISVKSDDRLKTLKLFAEGLHQRRLLPDALDQMLLQEKLSAFIIQIFTL